MAEPILTTILAILSAVIAATLGYLKARPNEDFDKEKFLRTVLIGLAVGVAQVLLNVAPGSAEGWVTMFLVQTGLIDTVERALKAIWLAYENRANGGRTPEYVDAKKEDPSNPVVSTPENVAKPS